MTGVAHRPLRARLGRTRGAIAIGPDVRRGMIAHARQEAPRECCGLLVGTPRRVHAALPCRNLARGVSRYRLDPRDHIRIQRELRETRLSIVGVYHSHPRGPAAPSPSDVAEAQYAEWIYAIVSLQDGPARLAGFRITATGASRVRLVTRRFASYRAGV